MKKLNEPLETLCAIVMLINANEHIHKNTWFEAEEVILKHKNQLQDSLTRKELIQGFNG